MSALVQSLGTKEQCWAIIVLPKKIDETYWEKVFRHSFDLQKSETYLFPIADIVKWTRFVDNLQKRSKKVPALFDTVRKLAHSYLSTENPFPILDIGCETGKNAFCLIKAGHRVALLDIALEPFSILSKI